MKKPAGSAGFFVFMVCKPTESWLGNVESSETTAGKPHRARTVD
ncbi:hypothetical protein [Qipengyuania mesophila]|nr:hypothetical protein [Qipengyuania mesophila]